MRYDRSMAIKRRHEDILSLVRNGAHSSRRLADELGVSEQTIYRDIVFLKANGHRIDAVRRAKGWAYQLLSGAQQTDQGRGMFK